MGGKMVAEGVAFAVNHLRSTGELNNLQAIVLSQSDGKCFFGKEPKDADLEEVAPLVAALGIPVFLGAPFGHGPVTRFNPIPLHTATTVTPQGCVVESVRSSEDVETVKNICRERLGRRGALNRSLGDAGRMFQEISASPVHGVSLPSGSRDYIACAIQPFHRGVDIPAFDGVDLAGKNLLVDFTSSGSFRSFKQAAQLSLMELVKTSRLQAANSILLLSRREIPGGFESWLKDFSERHQLGCSVSCAYAPDFPTNKILSNTPVAVTLNIANRGHSTSSISTSTCK